VGGTTFLVGIDDTDAGSSIGTGALARELMLHLGRDLGARARGITRHQLLVHPDIPYTSHNSSACLELVCEAGIEELGSVCQRFLELLFHPGADPGLCVATRAQASAEVLELGRRAQREILEKRAALDCASERGILLRELGGTGLGVIGALAACALRASEDDGRFIDLGQIRELPDRISVGELRQRTGISSVLDQDRRRLGDQELIVTGRWVRPNLQHGEIVLEVERSPEENGFRTAGKKRGEND